MDLARLGPARRLAVGLFLVSLVYFYAHAQWTLWVNVGQSALPTATDVLHKYFGTREKSRLEVALDPTRDPKADLFMYQYLYDSYTEGPEEQRERYAAIMAWVHKGAPQSGWPDVKAIFLNPKLCSKCHAPGQEMQEAPFTSFENVRRFAQIDTGMSVGRLARLSHSHLAGFALLGLATSLIFSFTRYRFRVSAPLILMVFLGPLVDVTGWWLTKYHGHPWQYLIVAGGACFGASLLAMVALALDELWLGGRATRLVAVARRRRRSRSQT